MLNQDNFKNIITAVFVIGLLVLAWIIVRPIIFSIIFGVLLAYIFYPIYKWILSKIKNKTISALIVCVGLLIIILGVLSLILSSLMSQVVDIYFKLQEINLSEIVSSILPDFLSSAEFSTTVLNSINTFISNFIADSLNSVGDFILNLPIILLQIFVIIFIFFYSLRDGRRGIDYLKSLLPLEKEIQEKFFKQFKEVTYSVLMGQIVVGIFQGLIAGIGYFIFGVPNTLLLTFLTIIIGIIPLIGPWLVWVPVDIYLFASGRPGAGLGLLIYGLVVISWLDTIIRSFIVSKKAEINPAIVIIGMVGGLFAFGFLGLIIGPLVLAYVLLIIELYRKKTFSQNIIFKRAE